MCAEDFLRANPESHTFIACGDAPFTDFKTIRAAYEYHKLSDSAVTVVTAEIAEPKGYGRIIRTKTGISGIVEEKDCTYLRDILRLLLVQNKRAVGGFAKADPQQRPG